MRFAIGVTLLIGLYAHHVRAATVYVSSRDVALRQEQTVSARIVATLQRGDTLDVLERQERWYYVTTAQGQRGWIYRFNVSDQPPQQGGGDVWAVLGGASSGVSIGESSSAVGIRGLNPLAEQHARRQGQQQALEAVRAMEQFRVSREELMHFMRSGNLGEYYQEGR